MRSRRRFGRRFWRGRWAGAGGFRQIRLGNFVPPRSIRRRARVPPRFSPLACSVAAPRPHLASAGPPHAAPVAAAVSFLRRAPRFPWRVALPSPLPGLQAAAGCLLAPLRIARGGRSGLGE
ncbi:hypothetical protein ZWY2020_043646 [Hordeum vulgare]|nr:hypothetical protein ZWY2020_043646 [Hordeum vulgare]